MSLPPDSFSGSQAGCVTAQPAESLEAPCQATGLEAPHESSSSERAQQDQALFSAALDLLSRREYSCYELRQKLDARFPEADFEKAFLRLQELNYQSDQRFAEVFARSRVMRGHGPIRIRQELRQKGIAADLIESSIDQLQSELDWFQHASEQLQRKFRSPVSRALPWADQQKERARRQRYLAYRGFSGDAVQFAIEELDRSGDE
ncbi:regulatory protein RecX [Microbulbifer celer]|uniref:Regulatory protein RecX n=1 Tax=Microbulbifer celer TaxID=435905 RepID=A0ABW3UC32_9GAMM|nr:regulatory protein RecX [Microbulbifer celer]UFN58170.1 recombination regulator RecX [Microbulbifer celer]